MDGGQEMLAEEDRNVFALVFVSGKIVCFCLSLFGETLCCFWECNRYGYRYGLVCFTLGFEYRLILLFVLCLVSSIV